MRNSAPHNTKCGGAHYKKCLMIIKTNPVVTRTELCGSPVEKDLLQWGQAENNLNPTMKEFQLLWLYTTAAGSQGFNKGLCPVWSKPSEFLSVGEMV